MISVGTVWDRTMEVIAGRFAILAAIALMLLFAPPLVQALIDAGLGTSSVPRVIGAIVSLLVFVAATVGALAITAIATDPSIDRGAALAIGGARIRPMLGIMIVLSAALLVVALPGIFLLGTSGFDPERARAGLSQENLDLARFGLAFLYFCALGIVLLWFAARLVPLLGVIVNERLGIGAIRRSFVLSRGSTLKLVGVLILYFVVMVVTLLAAVSITGLIARLVVGSDGAAAVAFVVAAATAIVTAAFSVLQAVFSGQFYLAARDVRGAA